MVKFDTKNNICRPLVTFHNMSNNKNNQITNYKTDNITTNDLRLIAN